MAKKISELTAVAAAAGTNEFPVNEAGTTKKVTITQATLALSAASASAQGVVTTGAQTFAGSKTFSSIVTISGANPGVTIDRTSGALSITAYDLSFSGARQGLLGISGGVDSLINGSVDGDTAIRASNKKILFSGDDGTTPHLTIGATGLIGVGDSSPDAQLDLVVSSSSTIGQIIQLAATPTANAFEINSSAGSGGDLFKIDSAGGIVVNDAGSDVDSRFEGDTDANLLFIDAGSDAIGMGTAAPAAKLHVREATVGDDVLTLASVADGDDVEVRLSQGRVATTDATVTTIKTIAIAASNTYKIHAEVVARRTGGVAGTADDGAVYIREAAYTTKAGTVTLLGSVASIFTAEDQAGWDITFTVSTTNVLIQVTGAVDNNITWHLVKCEVTQVGS